MGTEDPKPTSGAAASEDTLPTKTETAVASADPTPREHRASLEPLARGEHVGSRYIVQAELGRGGMGVVYRAYDPELDRRLALKLIHERERDALGSERLLREAQALAQLSHPNVVAVYDVGTFGSSVFMTMELVEGLTLRAWLRETRRSAAEILDVFLAAGEGLAAAHRANIVHRDFKPSNLLIGSDGRVRVADFGVARSAAARTGGATQSGVPAPAESIEPTTIPGLRRAVVASRSSTDSPKTPGENFGTPPSAAPPASPPSASERSGDQLTAEGIILGTPEYMSPEQHDGRAVDALSDQYSYCVCLWEAFHGYRPRRQMRASDLAERPGASRFARAAHKPKVAVPRRVRAVLARGLSERPQDRYPSMEALLVDLRLARHPPRPMWPLAIAGAALATAAVFGYRGLRGRHTSLCQGAPAKMSAIWNPARRQAVRSAFLASGVPYAEHAFSAVSAAIDRYTDEWAAGYVLACEDTRLRGEQSEDMLDRRMACLEQRRLELGAKVEVLARADRASLEKAAQTAQSLAPLGDCADRTRLASRVMPPDRATRAEVERSWQELGRAKALFESGRYAEGEPVARRVAEQAAQLGYRPLEADAELTLAQLLDARGEYSPAELTLRKALRAAQAGGVEDVAARAWIGLVQVVGVRQQHHAEAHEWALDAEMHLESMASSDATVGLLLSAEADLFYQEGKFEQAVETGQKARSILVRTLGSEAAPVAEVLKTIGNADADLGKTDAARIAYEQARDIWEKALGPDHPAVAAAWNNLGTLQLEHESFDDALAKFRRALDIWTSSLGPDHPMVAIATTNIGEALRALGDREGATAAFRSALAIRTRALGADHPLCAGNIANLGNIALDVGDNHEAYRWFQQALEIWEKRLGPKDQHVATALTGLGDALVAEKAFTKAIPLYQRALAIQEEALGSEHLYLVDALAGLGHAYVGLRQDRPAREQLERALKLAEAQAADPVLLAGIRLGLAEALWRTGMDRVRARALAVAARDGFVPLGKRGERGAKKANEWLAMAR
jgi:serine/threonine protein kinase/tetratricopeptide (TPR) repeat protein